MLETALAVAPEGMGVQHFFCQQVMQPQKVLKCGCKQLESQTGASGYPPALYNMLMSVTVHTQT